jgi:hypothetical protein
VITQEFEAKLLHDRNGRKVLLDSILTLHRDSGLEYKVWLWCRWLQSGQSDLLYRTREELFCGCVDVRPSLDPIFGKLLSASNL